MFLKHLLICITFTSQELERKAAELQRKEAELKTAQQKSGSKYIITNFGNFEKKQF